MSSLSSSSPGMKPSPAPLVKLMDIGANMLDKKFKGEYNGSQRHPPDLDAVLCRSLTKHDRHNDTPGACDRVIFTAGTLSESRLTLTLAETINARCSLASAFSTAGFHPTSAREYEEGVFDFVMGNAAPSGPIVALGELGLDYDRLHFASKDDQMESLLKQLDISERLIAEGIRLPLFIHSRNVGEDLYSVLSENRAKWSTGVVHSFDDSLELAEKYMSLGLYIGLNGCSLHA